MHRPLLEQALRFAAVGTAASAAHVAIALTLIERAGLPILTANGLAFTSPSRLLYRQSQLDLHARRSPRTAPASIHRDLACRLALNQTIVFTTVTWAGLPYLVGILIVIAVVPCSPSC